MSTVFCWWLKYDLYKMLQACTPEISSAEEEVRKRKRRKITKPKKPVPLPLGSNVDIALMQLASDPEAKQFKPELKSLSAIFTDADHLCKDSKKSCRCKGPSNDKLAKDAELKKLSDKEDPDAIPAIQRCFQEIMARLQPPRLTAELYGLKLTEEETVQQICNGPGELPCLDASFESRLLLEAGRFALDDGAMRDFPKCVLDEECIMNKDYGKICCALMSRDEYDKFLQSNKQPNNARVCIPCHRDAMSALTFTRRQQLPNYPTLPPDKILQLYTNKTDCEEGYYDSDCIKHPASQAWEGFIGAIACYRKSRLKHVVLKNGQHAWDQSAMIWKHPKIPIPGMGERNQDF
jgi:hypothetical protein